MNNDNFMSQEFGGIIDETLRFKKLNDIKKNKNLPGEEISYSNENLMKIKFESFYCLNLTFFYL